MRLKDRVAIITGGSRGIGRAVALGFAREGATVVAVGGSELAAAQEVAETIQRELGRPSLGLVADVSDRAQVDALVAETLQRFGRVDILVTCHGIIAPVPFLEMRAEQWTRTLAVHLTGTFHCIQAVLPQMLARKYGRIITVTGPSALRTSPNGVADYAASKAGVIILTRTVMRELQGVDADICLNCVSPVAYTRMTDALARFHGKTVEQYGADHPRAQVPPPEEVVPTFVFLASEAASYVKGQVIAADGGRTV
jgi:3-oxoacyl-[acyl-carrier protein] reductase